MAEVLGGILARAAKLTKVELCGFVAASSHVHLLCRARDGQLSRFMRYFLSNVSKKAGRLVGWSGNFWERRFSAIPVLDDTALERRLKYILAHGVKEGLVRKVGEWPGLSCLGQLLGEATRAFPFYEWARRWQSGKLLPGGNRRWSPTWTTTEELVVHPLPRWEAWTPQKRKQRVQKLIDEIEAEGRAKHRRVKGRQSVIDTHPHTRKRNPDRRKQPWFLASSKRAGRHHMALYSAFVGHFRAAVEKLRKGASLKKAEFPAYAFVPCIPLRV